MFYVATRDDLRNDILKVTEEQQKLMELRKSFLGSKDNEDQMNAFRITTQNNGLVLDFLFSN